MCLLSGLNGNTIQSGVVAVINITVSATATTVPISVSNPLGATANGQPIQTSASGGTVNVSILALVSGVICIPTTVAPGGSSLCTVTLSALAPFLGATVSLSSGDGVLTVPASVSVLGGLISAVFTANAGNFTTSQSATITASLNGSSQNVTLNLVAPMIVSTVACNPTGSPNSFNCTITLNQAAPAGGSVVAIASNDSALSVPATVTVPTNSTSANFAATATNVTTNQNAIVTAALNGSSQSTTISLVGSLVISSLSCNSTQLNAGAGTLCTITLSAPAPSGGVTVSLSSANTNLATHSSVAIPGASASATFGVAAAGVTPLGEEPASLTATLNNSSQSLAFTIMCPCSIWPTTAVPINPASSNQQAIEVGMRFTSASSGYVTGVRFYKGAANTGTHVGNLWSSTGTLLGTVTFANETASGWQTAYFPASVPINANTTYIISYHAPAGHNAADAGYFTNNGVNNAPLLSPEESQSASNGVYIYGASAFPTTDAAGTNYWVDVIVNLARTVGVATPVSLWKISDQPATAAAPSSTAAELGTTFTTSTNGYVTGVRFFKSYRNTGTHVGYLWTAAGTLLGSVTFTNEGTAGWQQANFAVPIPISANTTYVISYWAPQGYYAGDAGYFATSGVTSQMLYAPVDGQYGPNGAFSSTQAFPNMSLQSSNYWVDVVFSTALQ